VIEDWIVSQPLGLRSSTVASRENNEAGLPSYVVTLSTSTLVTAVADLSKNGIVVSPDGRCPNITVGGLPVTVLSCGATNVTFRTPLYEELCSAGSGACGYHAVVIQNPNENSNDAGYSSSASSMSRLGGKITCPGSCPLRGRGFFYTEQCAGYHEPERCSLLLPSDQFDCAFGTRDDCRRCALNAFCPGGFRMWPMEGYWTESEEVGSVTKCPSPPKLRCRGWDITDSEAECGEGFAGVLCARCAEGYHSLLDLCVPCPEDHTLLLSVGLLAGFALTLFVLIRVCLCASPIYRQLEQQDQDDMGQLQKHLPPIPSECPAGVQPSFLFQKETQEEREKKLKKLEELIAWQARDFVVWTLLFLQNIAIVVTSAGSNNTVFVLVFSWLKIFSLDFQAVGPECHGQFGGFLSHIVMLATDVAALIVYFLLTMPCALNRQRVAKRYKGRLMTFLVAMYAPSVYMAMGLTYCVESNDGKWVSWYNPDYACAAGAHLHVMALGSFVLLIHGIGFPLYTFVRMREVFVTNDDRMNAIHYRMFFGDDFKSESFWVHHCQMMVRCAVCATSVYFTAYNEEVQWLRLCINTLACSSLLAILAMIRPYVPHMEWKFPVQFSFWIFMIMLTVLQFLNYMQLEKGWMSKDAIDMISIAVLIFGIVNLLVLAVAFYWVVLREKSAGYYQSHFIMQNPGTGRPVAGVSPSSSHSAVTRRVPRFNSSDSKTGSRMPLHGSSASGLRSVSASLSRVNSRRNIETMSRTLARSKMAELREMRAASMSPHSDKLSRSLSKLRTSQRKYHLQRVDLEGSHIVGQQRRGEVDPMPLEPLERELKHQDQWVDKHMPVGSVLKGVEEGTLHTAHLREVSKASLGEHSRDNSPAR